MVKLKTIFMIGSVLLISQGEGESRYQFVQGLQPKGVKVLPINAVVEEKAEEKNEAKASAASAVQPGDLGFLTFLNQHDQVGKEKISKETHHFYTSNNYKPVWFPNGQRTKASEVALSVLANSFEEGLNPEDYQAAINANPEKNWMEAEILLTNTFLNFIHDVRVGRIPASHVARTIKIVSPETKPVEALENALNSSNGDFSKLRQMAPELEDYAKLKTLLEAYRKLALTPNPMPKLKADKKKIKLKVGQSNEEVAKLKKILFSLGYLENLTDSRILDENVMEALKEFQRYHSLDDDGTIGPETIKALNWTLDDRIKKIIANMERLRWLPDHLGHKFILVNVGGYEVTAVTDGKVDHRIKAIVGKKSRRTPLFYAPLKNIIINPSWGVPTSILLKDKIPKIRNDPSYVERAGFTVYDSSGDRLNPYDVNWESVGSSIRLRQSPGAHNALGRIKFNIENPYTIYLHGTPTESLFKRGTRNFSSGCIRLEEPNVLAEWVLKDVNGWSEKDIEGKINDGGTKTISIDQSIPVYFSYLTVWVDDAGKTHFSPDAYDLDNSLIKALDIQTGVPLQVAVGKNYKIRYA